MIKEVYSYHQAPTAPTGDIDNKIFGLELEINDDSQIVRNLLDSAIETNYLTSPENEHETRGLKTIERDGSVYREIVFPADEIPYLLKRVKNLNNIGIEPNNINNTGGTSAHIHFNRRYLEMNGITETNLFKMLEYLEPVIFAISGRDYSNFQHWSPSALGHETNNINWEARAQRLRSISPNHHDRYNMVNCTNSKTIELRAFSNYCSFDYQTIKLYLEFCDLIIELCDYMIGRYYRHNWEKILKRVKDFFLTNHLWAWDKFKLANVFRLDRHIATLKRRFDYYRSEIIDLNHMKRHHPTQGALTYIWYRRKMIHLKQLTMSKKGVNNQLDKIENEYYKCIGSYMFQYMRTLEREILINGEL